MKQKEAQAASEAPVNKRKTANFHRTAVFCISIYPKRKETAMKHSINIRYFSAYIGMKKAAEFIANAGFTHLDYTPYVMCENWEELLKEDVKIINEYGLKVHQAHFPFNRYGSYKDQHKLYIDRVVNAGEQLGVKYYAVHGDEFDFENRKFSKDAALEYNHNYFLPYVERAKKNSYKIAFETLFEDWDRPRFTSEADDLYNLIGSYGCDAAVCCWDFGHGHISFGQKAPEVIERFGSLIQCTHLHDSAGNDSHQLPTTGDIDWKSTIGAFKKIGYEGVLSVEYAHGKIPEQFVSRFIDLTYKTSEYLYTL